jgi:hypothetical protein
MTTLNYTLVIYDMLSNFLFTKNIIPSSVTLQPHVIKIKLQSRQQTLKQKVSLYAKWFHWILSESISCSEWAPVKKQWIHRSSV